MAAIPLRDETLKQLRDKVVVISGSAHGIGRATVELLYAHGAKIVHADWDAEAGAEVSSSLSSSSNSNAESSQPKIPGGEATFVQTDVTDYDSVLALFETAWMKYGRVNVAISNAGVQEMGGWFERGLGREGVKTVMDAENKQKPPTKTIDVNLLGTLYFSRIACAYMAETTTPPSPQGDKSLLLLSSTAGFKETPGLFAYTASKHGVLGLLRSLRPYLPKTHGIRTNAICPWMTDTVMVSGIRDAWLAASLPVNTPQAVARLIVEVALGTVPEGGVRMKDEGVVEDEGKGGEGKGGEVRYNGRAVFVEGGRGWDIESGIEGCEGRWLGEEVSRCLGRGQVVLGDGMDW